MPVKNLVLLLLCLCFLGSIYGQKLKTNDSYKKLEFKEGIPGELKKLLNNISAENCSYAEINMDVAADILYIISYNAPNDTIKYYRVRKSDLTTIIRFEFTKDSGIDDKMKIIEYDEDECYDYHIILIKDVNNISYTVENKKNNFEFGLIGEIGLNSLSDDSNTGQRYSGKDWTDRSLSGLGGVCLSTKYMLGTSNKAELRIGSFEFNDNWGLDLGVYFHQKIKTNFYAAVGSTFEIRSRYSMRYVKFKYFKLAHVMPTASLIYYLSSKTYFMSSFFLDFNDNAEYYNKESRWGVKIGIGMNII